MKRWHDEKHIAERNLKNRKQLVHNPNDRFAKLGRYRKKDAYDCGNPKCYICHSSKLMGHKRPQEIISDFKMKEQIKEAS